MAVLFCESWLLIVSAAVEYSCAAAVNDNFCIYITFVGRFC